MSSIYKGEYIMSSQAKIKKLLENKLIHIKEIGFNPIQHSFDIHYVEQNGTSCNIEFCPSRKRQKGICISFWDEKEGFEYNY